MKSSRICLVSQELPPETARGGIGTQTWNKARALARLGHSVHVLSWTDGSTARTSSDPNSGITIHRMESPGFNVSLDAPITWWIGYTWSVLRHLKRLMRTIEFDLIDFPEYGAEGFAYQLDRAPWNWVPVVVQLHGPLAMFGERMGWPEKNSELFRVGTFMEGCSIRKADRLMACSKNIAEFTTDFYGISEEAVDVVHCGVDTDAFHPPDQSERVGEPSVLFVGKIARNKGVETVFDAVLQLRHKYPHLRLQVVGKADNDLESTLRRAARTEGVANAIEFSGFVDPAQLPAFYRRAHVFASPATHEPGVANVYLEAMASGCPVIAATTGGAPEAVIDGETGILVPPGDAEATAVALDRILGDVGFRLRLGEGARRRVEEYFAMDRYIQRVLAAYARAIDASSHRRYHWKHELA